MVFELYIAYLIAYSHVADFEFSQDRAILVFWKKLQKTAMEDSYSCTAAAVEVAVRFQLAGTFAHLNYFDFSR
jgi:hypothetical protein